MFIKLKADLLSIYSTAFDRYNEAAMKLANWMRADNLIPKNVLRQTNG